MNIIPKNANCKNYAFDVTPAKFITKIITEKKVIDANKSSILELDEESLNLIKDKTEDIAFLVRVKNVDFTESCKNYKDDDIDGLKIRIAVE